jgi:hypothetical protein
MAASLRCLVLNTSMEPLSVVSAQRGLLLLQRGRIEVLQHVTKPAASAKALPQQKAAAGARSPGRDKGSGAGKATAAKSDSNTTVWTLHLSVSTQRPSAELSCDAGVQAPEEAPPDSMRVVTFRSGRESFPVPSVVILRTYVRPSYTSTPYDPPLMCRP